jgi:lipopolysaccharide transport protein LptA
MSMRWPSYLSFTGIRLMVRRLAGIRPAGIGLAGLIGLTAMFGQMSFAQTPSVLFSTAPDAPIYLQAAKISVAQSDNRTALNGKAILRQGDLTLSADAMQVIFDPNTGSIAQDIFATGAVVLIDQKGQISRAQQAHLRVQEDILLMRGNVVIENQQADSQFSSLTGAQLRVDMRTGQSQMLASTNTDNAPTTEGAKPRIRIQLNP